MDIYTKLLTILAESTEPKYWSEAELLECIREAQAEVVRRTKILRKNVVLKPRIDIDGDVIAGVFELPADCIEIIGVQFEGKPLDKKSLKFMDSAYSGSADQRVIAGEGVEFSTSWRDTDGSPVHWLFDACGILLYPKPEVAGAIQKIELVESQSTFVGEFVGGIEYDIYYQVLQAERAIPYGRPRLLTPNEHYYETNTFGTIGLLIELPAGQIVAVPADVRVSVDYVYDPPLSLDAMEEPEEPAPEE